MKAGAAVQPDSLSGRRILQIAILVLAAAFVYSPAFHGGWLWDDNEDLPQNLLLRDPAALSWILDRPAGAGLLPFQRRRRAMGAVAPLAQ